MRKVMFLVILLVFSYSVIVYAAPSIGLTTVGEIQGVSIKTTEGQFRPQFIGYLFSSSNRTDVTLGVRGLYSLGKVGQVDRYTGLGVGYSYNSDSQNVEGTSLVSGQIFVGIEFPFDYKNIVTPFNISLEALLEAKKHDDQGLEIRNRFGIGVHYPF